MASRKRTGWPTASGRSLRPPRTSEKIGSETERKAALSAVVQERKAVRSQLVVDLLDVWPPATGLGVVNVNDGVAGILGCVF